MQHVTVPVSVVEHAAFGFKEFCAVEIQQYIEIRIAIFQYFLPQYNTMWHN